MSVTDRCNYRCFYCMPAALICVTSRPCRWARKRATAWPVIIPLRGFWNGCAVMPAPNSFPSGGSRGAGPARYYQIGKGPVRVGAISAVSRHFCAGCNRARLTAAGELVLCLGRSDRASLREALRDGYSDEAMETTIRAAIAHKPERHDFPAARGEVVSIPMYALGG